MMKAPTSRAAPEKASSAGVRKLPMLSLACLASSAAVCSPVLISRLRGSAWRRRATSSVGVTPGAAEATTRETLPSSPYQDCTSAIGRDDQRRPADRGHVAVVGDADQAHVLDAGPRRHADALADREVLVLGQLAIDEHLAALPGQPPRHVAQRIEGLAHRGDDDRRRELRLDRLAL